MVRALAEASLPMGAIQVVGSTWEQLQPDSCPHCTQITQVQGI